MNFFRSPEPGWPKLPLPDDSIEYFKAIKSITEMEWMNTAPNKSIYGFQIQAGSKWLPGLTEEEICMFQERVGLEFPDCLKNFYRCMNGLTLPGINIHGSNGHAPTYSPVFYSYPEDLALIEELNTWIYQASNVDLSYLSKNGISRIFPITGHRFLLIDIPGTPVLSMYGSDIIFWAENLSKCLAVETVGNIFNVYDFESRMEDVANIKFWLD